MARTIRVGDIGDYANSQMEKLLRSAVLETDAFLNRLAQLIPAGFALAGHMVKMQLAVMPVVSNNQRWPICQLPANGSKP
jgi:hypothetical protein